MPTLPEGTVTVLFTDIESSTRLLQELGEAYGSLLTDHRRLLSSQFEEHDGVVVDTQGDAFFVAFRRARDAVVAAIAAQQALAAHNWSESARPRVRMAIHTGEPSRVGEGLVGLSVHRAARICSAGHGGQVLLSATTRDLVEDHLPPGVALIDLGTHRLKDLDRSEEIAQVVIEGIPPVFTPLKTPEDQSVDATPFAGRGEELATLAQDAIAAAPHKEVGTLMRRIAAARARALDWRGFIYVPGHTRFANRLEGLGFSILSTARIAPRDLNAEFRALGRAFVTAARDARAANRLLRNEDQRTLARRLAHGREWAYEEHHLREADRVAEQISALKRLVEARRRFETEARRLEPRVRGIRTRVFDARVDSAARDELIQELQSLQESAEVLTAMFHTAYDQAAAYSRER